MNAARGYRGRFAPSPTGPLHFGSLVAAAAGYLDALAHAGEWLVRIEDIDPTREVPGAAAAILDALAAHGFEFPQPLFQSTRLERYAAVINDLVERGLAYPCACSRRILAKSAQPGRAGLIYPGTCRAGPVGDRPATAVRLRCDDTPVCFSDRVQGVRRCRLEREIGDFLLRRGDGYVAYQLAVAVDDHDQGITDVVRGTDLLDSTFMQLAVFRAAGWAYPPAYLHLPVVTGTDGQKLSKQSGAPPVDCETTDINILRCFSYLGLNPPAELRGAAPGELWAWGAERWDPQALTGLWSSPETGIMVR